MHNNMLHFISKDDHSNSVSTAQFTNWHLSILWLLKDQHPDPVTFFGAKNVFLIVVGSIGLVFGFQKGYIFPNQVMAAAILASKLQYSYTLSLP